MDIHVVALVETDHYFIEPRDVEYIAQIRGVYLFDKEKRTHCCELTPSYYLIHLYDQIILSESGDALNENEKDRLYQAYEYNGGEDIYVHCHEIDALVEKADPGEHYVYGDSEVAEEDVEYDDQIEAVREHLCGNCPL